MRIILYTGKGGVGKTSISAMTAVKLAKEGQRVMILSTDQAHSLSDSLDIPLSSVPTRIIPNLEAVEIDVVKEAEDAWGNMKDYIKRLLCNKAQNGIESEELLVFPGLEELFALFRILEIYDRKEHDVLIVDCAPTGETLALLKFPEMFGQVIDKVLPMKRKVLKKVGPLVEKTTKIPMPEDSVFDDVERLIGKLERLQAILIDREVTSMRIVGTPEKIVVKETKRNFTWLQLYDYNVDAVFVNKVYPKEALEGYFDRMVQLQEEGLEELEAAFADVPLFKVMLQKNELRTVDTLEDVSRFYGDVNPGEVLMTRQVYKIYSNELGSRMEIYLPFSNKQDMELEQYKGEIHIAIKNERRTVMIPDALLGKNIVGAKLDNKILAIDFA
jgi:arsenite-transporting ATPase